MLYLEWSLPPRVTSSSSSTDVKVQQNKCKSTQKVTKKPASATVNVIKAKKKIKQMTSTRTAKPQSTGSFFLTPLSTLKVLKVGSDCSGWASEVWALLKLGVNKFDHMFACDINRWPKKFIMDNDPPKVWLDDVLAVDHHEQAPYVDVYVAGFPCQPLSIAGSNLGTEDVRGKVIHGVMKYIEHRLPTVFILENVKNQVSTTHQEFFNKLIAWMRGLKLVDGSLAYDVQWHVFNSKHFGVPQNRERVYSIGRRTNTLLKSYTPTRPSSAT